MKSTTAIVKAKPANKTEENPHAGRPADPLVEIVSWIISGHAQQDIVEAVAERWPRVKAAPLIAQALREIAAQGRPDKMLLMGFVLEGTREIYKKALAIGDFQTALAALRQLHTLSR